ncbi:nuclear transport factor 2 family protein [Actinopolymorpha alba]|uniref:nuclear transport factor 2 family protein n=1 Tax=Actinopolymorpha alba TaxID=533267 RepID=UPI000360BB6B|nr:nuclear transport factor 2 family protein [Actinopolymorpha alba]
MTENSTALSASRIIEQYERFWNSPAEKAQPLADQTFVADIRYLAPIGEFTGSAPLIGFRRQFEEHLPAFTFAVVGEPQSHHDRLRLHWEIRTGGEDAFAAGTDVLTLEQDGRIREVVTFLDRAPEGFDPQAHHDLAG